MLYTLDKGISNKVLKVAVWLCFLIRFLLKAVVVLFVIGVSSAGFAPDVVDDIPASPLSGRKRWRCQAKCALVGVGENNDHCTGFVLGTGSGNTLQSACRAAKKDASRQAPRGCRTKHCRCLNCSRS